MVNISYSSSSIISFKQYHLYEKLSIEILDCLDILNQPVFQNLKMDMNNELIRCHVETIDTLF